ncbi:MAG: serine/threonine-protein kinase [Anaeromyxobacter sp.]
MPGDPFGVAPAEYERLDRLLDAALDLSPGERERFLAALAGEDAALAPRLRALLEGGAPLRTLPDLGPATLPGPAPAGPDLATPAAGRPAVGSPGALVGPYRLATVLGEGGMATVWLARRADGTLDRAVALKLPRDAAGFAERLARERDILAGLAHPGIARLYDAGVAQDGQPFLALEFVDGVPIDAHARARRLFVPARLELFLQAAAALAYAHGRLVVHRDLKPSNLLVTGDGDVRLLDFGIARLLGGAGAAEAAVTRQGAPALTPAYASPEQIRGEPQGVASDVFSLGVVLYELLAGVRPFDAPSRRALEDAILEAEARPPSVAARDPAVARALRGDLDTIVLKALRKAPEERYPTVDAFADDVRRYLAGLPVLARRGGALYRLRKHLLRHPFATAAAALGVAALLLTTGAALLSARRALAERDRAEEAKTFIVSLLRAADPYVAGRPLTAADLLEQARARIDRDLGARPELRVELLTEIGTSLVHLQALDAADRLLAEAVEDGERSLGPADRLTLLARLARADVHRLRGRIDAFEADLTELLPRLRAAPWATPDVVGQALRLGAFLELSRGRPRRAVALAEEARAVALAAGGERTRLALNADMALALAQAQAGGVDEALRLSARVLEIASELGGGQPRTASLVQARIVRAVALGASGDRAAATDLLRAAAADARALFGPESTVLAFVLPRVAQHELLVGELDEALRDAEGAVRALRGRALPGTHIEATALDARGRALLALGRAGDALADLEAVAEVEQRVVGPAHPRAASARLRLAHALALDGQRARAGTSSPGRGPGGAPAAEALLVEGSSRALAGAPARAAALHREGSAAAEGPEADLLRARLEGQLGLDLLAAGDAGGAAAALAGAVDGLRRLQRAPTPELRGYEAALARARRR